MKVTQIRSVRPVGSSSSLGGGGGTIDGGGENFGGGFPPSGQVPVATGSNTWAWASNVQLITANGSNKLLGPFVNIASGSNIILTMDVGPFPGQAFPSNTVRIHSTGSGGGGGSTIIVQDEGSTLGSSVTTLNFTGAGVTATGTTTVTVDVPGGSSSDETIPSGGTLYNGTSTSGWTTFGSSLTFDANTTVPGAFYLAKTTMGSGEVVGAYRAVGGSFPRTYTLRVKDAMFHADFHGVQILLGEASPGKFWTFGPVRDGGNRYFQRESWTNATTAAGNVNYPTTTDVLSNPAVWLRYVVNSSTDIEYWMSWNGYIYYRYASAINPGFTIGVFGFSMYTFAAIEHKAAFDWIHET